MEGFVLDLPLGASYREFKSLTVKTEREMIKYVIHVIMKECDRESLPLRSR